MLQPSDELQDIIGHSNPMLRYKSRTETNRIIIHDSHTPPEVGQAHEVSSWALEAADNAVYMGLLSIGYHYIIERDGKIVCGRHREKIGSHTPGFNMDSIGICWVGGRDHEGGPEENITPKQYKSLLRLLNNLRADYGKPLRIIGHSEIQKYRDASLPPCPQLDMALLREDLVLYEQGIEL